MREDETDGYALKAGKGIQIDFRGTKMTVKVAEEAYSFMEMLHPPNVGPATHIHPKGSEAFYVLEGEYTIHCNEEIYSAHSGDFVFIPKGVPHSYHTGAEGGKVLVISPAGLEKYFSEVADVLKTGSIAWEQEQEIARRYGQEFLDKLKHWGQ
jgi:mannose-6-phosphate isomerase-like protein (cupin superfamily)